MRNVALQFEVSYGEILEASPILCAKVDLTAALQPPRIQPLQISPLDRAARSLTIDWDGQLAMQWCPPSSQLS